MPIDLSAINLNLIGWLIILAAALVLAAALLHFFGHLLHIFIRGCGVIVLAGVILYVLHLLKIL